MVRPPEDLVRDGRGKFVSLIKTAERDDRCAQLQARGYTLARIATEVGFASESAAYRAITRARARVPIVGAEELRARELAHMEQLRQAMAEVLEKTHRMVQNGKVVRRVVGSNTTEGGDTEYEYEDVLDDGPRMAAVDRMLRIAERLAKLTGIDAPEKVHTSGTILYQIVGVDTEQI